MTLKLGTDKVLVELEDDYEEMTPSLTVGEALTIIMRNERGRQGQIRALNRKRLVESETSTKAFEDGTEISEPDKIELDEHQAAVMVQKVFRGHKARKDSNKARVEELTFIGMRPKSTERLDNLRAQLEYTEKLRREDQVCGDFSSMIASKSGSNGICDMLVAFLFLPSYRKNIEKNMKKL